MKTFLKGFKKGMEHFGQGITIIVNSILLLAVYLVGVGLTSLCAKIFRKQFLNTKLTKEGTYWTNVEKKEKETHYRQF